MKLFPGTFKLQEIVPWINSSPIICDNSTDVLRPLVPLCYRSGLFKFIHSLAHLSVKTTQKLIFTPFHLAPNKFWLSKMGPLLLEFPTSKNLSPCGFINPSRLATIWTVWRSSCRHPGTPSPIQKIHIPLHNCRSLFYGGGRPYPSLLLTLAWSLMHLWHTKCHVLVFLLWFPAIKVPSLRVYFRKNWQNN